MIFNANINEKKWSKKIIETLLIDRTTKKNIVWATNDYEHLGTSYNSHYPITYESITGYNANVIQPRILKSVEKKGNRTKDKAEVFTPSWICNEQNNLIDRAWFERDNVFNIEGEKKWRSKLDKIEFPKVKSKTWENYVDERRMEITCGEAPYLVSRYDTVTGKEIDLYERIGLLDRKLRVVAENTNSEKEWLKWSERAFQSVYGFEFQGDSLLLARENLLETYIDYMRDKLYREPTEKELLKIATIISWNLWQMDGLTFTTPFQNPQEPNIQLSLFEDVEQGKKIMCIIKDWRESKIITFKTLIDEGDLDE